MRIGVPREIKNSERRVAMTPTGVRTLVYRGHTVMIEEGAGAGSGFYNHEYVEAGAHIVTQQQAWDVDMVVKVKEPQEEEYGFFGNQILFTYLHLAADRKLTLALANSKVCAMAYEMVQLDNGTLPLLVPMSIIAGRLSVQAGAFCLEARNSGKGVLLSGAPGVRPAKVVIVGAGTAGRNATMIAHGMGALITVLDIDTTRLEQVKNVAYSATTLVSNPAVLAEEMESADLVISTVLAPNGAKAPKLITREMLRRMEPGSAFVDVSIDQGGAAESSMPTTHENPTYVDSGIVHYCVANMPGAVPRTSTCALTNATLPYIEELAEVGETQPFLWSDYLQSSINVCGGEVTADAVRRAHEM